MIDIIVIADSIFKMNIIVNGREDIFLCNMFRNQFMYVFLNRFSQKARILTVFFQNLLQYRIINEFRNAEFFRITVHMARNVYHHVRQYLDILFLSLNPYIRNRRVLNGICHFSSHRITGTSKHFTSRGVNNIFCQNMISDSVP